MCWKCGSQFNPTQLLNCPAKNSTCSKFKLVGHFNSLCKEKMPERKPRHPRYNNNNPQYGKENQVRRVRHAKTNESDQSSEQLQMELIDAEAAIFIKKTSKRLETIYLIKLTLTELKEETNNKINPSFSGEF